MCYISATFLYAGLGFYRRDSGLLENYTASFDKIYGQLIKRNIKPENIYRIGPDTNLKNVNALTGREAIQDALSGNNGWARKQIGANGAAPLFIVMIGHGGTEGEFYVGDDSHYITPSDLNTWLTDLETSLSSTKGISLRSVVINGACYSGTYIPVLEKSGRTIIASASPTMTAVQGPPPSPKDTVQLPLGDEFTITLLTNLAQPTTNTTLMQAFKTAAGAIAAMSPQSPLFDDTGTGAGKTYLRNSIETTDWRAAASFWAQPYRAAGSTGQGLSPPRRSCRERCLPSGCRPAIRQKRMWSGPR